MASPYGRARTLFCAAALVLSGVLPAVPAAAASPNLQSVSPQTFAPGATLTLKGSGFGSTPGGDAVVLVGPDLGAPSAAASVVSWSPNRIVVDAPAAGVWPGAATLEVLVPGAATSNQLPVTVIAPGTAITAPAAAWLPAAGGGGLDVGWYDAAGTPSSPLTLTLPLQAPGGAAAFTVPSALPAGSVEVDGAPAGAAVGGGTLTWPDGTQTPASVITLSPAHSLPAGPVTVTISAAAGLQAADGVDAVGIASGLVSASAPLDVSPGAAVAFRVSVPASVTPGVPFPVEVQAVDGAGAPAAAAPGTVYLTSANGTLDFPSAAETLDGPATAATALVAGAAQVTAVAGVAGAATVRVTSMAGLTGSAAFDVAAPASGGVRVQLFPAFSGFSGGTTYFDAANVQTLGLHSGTRSPGPPSPTSVYSGWWPLGVGQPYEADWTGEISLRAPPILPSPLPQPQDRFAFLNVAAKAGASATLTPVAGSGASIDGSTAPLGLASAAAGGGPATPTVVTLTPGRYGLTVQATDDAAQGGAGDTLYYSEAFAPTAAPATNTIFATTAQTLWSPLQPVPPAAFTGAGLPDPALRVTIGASSADARGAPVALLQPAAIIGGSTMLPLRALAQALGASVSWNPATHAIAVAAGGQTADLTVGSTQASVDGQPVTLAQAATLVPPGVTLVPLRFLGQALGWQVGWNPAASQAVLLPPLSGSVPETP